MWEEARWSSEAALMIALAAAQGVTGTSGTQSICLCTQRAEAEAVVDLLKALLPVPGAQCVLCTRGTGLYKVVAQIVVGTPDRIGMLIDSGAISVDAVQALVVNRLDEIHGLFGGGSLRAATLKIKSALPPKARVRVASPHLRFSLGDMALSFAPGARAAAQKFAEVRFVEQWVGAEKEKVKLEREAEEEKARLEAQRLENEKERARVVEELRRQAEEEAARAAAARTAAADAEAARAAAEKAEASRLAEAARVATEKAEATRRAEAARVATEKAEATSVVSFWSCTEAARIAAEERWTTRRAEAARIAAEEAKAARLAEVAQAAAEEAEAVRFAKAELAASWRLQPSVGSWVLSMTRLRTVASVEISDGGGEDLESCASSCPSTPRPSGRELLAETPMKTEKCQYFLLLSATKGHDGGEVAEGEVTSSETQNKPAIEELETDGAVEPPDYSGWSWQELRDECRAWGLPCCGSWYTLADRLTSAQEAAEVDDPEAAPDIEGNGVELEEGGETEHELKGGPTAEGEEAETAEGEGTVSTESEREKTSVRLDLPDRGIALEVSVEVCELEAEAGAETEGGRPPDEKGCELEAEAGAETEGGRPPDEIVPDDSRAEHQWSANIEDVPEPEFDEKEAELAAYLEVAQVEDENEYEDEDESPDDGYTAAEVGEIEQPLAIGDDSEEEELEEDVYEEESEEESVDSRSTLDEALDN